MSPPQRRRKPRPTGQDPVLSPPRHTEDAASHNKVPHPGGTHAPASEGFESMSEMVFFTNNYTDQSTREGYQCEFDCLRCGNGYASTFKHSVTGFGGRLLRMGGDLLGGQVGEKAAQVGWDAEWMRDGNRGTTRDKHLQEAAQEMQS